MQRIKTEMAAGLEDPPKYNVDEIRIIFGIHAFVTEGEYDVWRTDTAMSSGMMSSDGILCVPLEALEVSSVRMCMVCVCVCVCVCMCVCVCVCGCVCVCSVCV
jgi:hypothetical protein